MELDFWPYDFLANSLGGLPQTLCFSFSICKISAGIALSHKTP